MDDFWYWLGYNFGWVVGIILFIGVAICGLND
jgi:hypothetical protein